MTTSALGTHADNAQSARATGTSARRGSRLVALDGLRFLAALMVVLYHYIGQGTKAWQHSMTSLFPKMDVPASYGFLGVELFFLISGFVICMSSWNRDLGQFFVSRATRLYPAFWLAIVAITGFITVWPAIATHLTPSQVLVNMTLFNEPLHIPDVNPVCWTLWAELRFYLLFAIVVWRGVTYRRVILFCALWTVASIITSATGDSTMTEIFQPEYSPYFIAGIAMYLMYRFRPTPLLWAIVALSWVFSENSLVGRIDEGKQWVFHPLHWWVGAVAITVFYLLVLASALGWLDWVRGRWVTQCGGMTYPLYLLHLTIGWTIIRMLHRHLPPYVLLFGLIAVMIAVSWLVYRFVETPLAPRLKRGLLRGIADSLTETRRVIGSGAASHTIRTSRAAATSDGHVGQTVSSGGNDVDAPRVPQQEPRS